MKIIKILFILSFLPMLSGCNLNITGSNVCRKDLYPYIRVKNIDQLPKKELTQLLNISKEKKILLSYDLINNIKMPNKGFTSMYFNDSSMIESDKVYRFQYNNDEVYFIYNIHLANSTHDSMCNRDTTYNINQCTSDGYNIYIDPSCAIPADQADKYFEKYIKPTMQ